MSNIVWKRPDGGVSITILSAEALELQAWAAGQVALLDEKIPLLAERAALEVALAGCGVQIDRVRARAAAATAAARPIADPAAADAVVAEAPPASDSLIDELVAAQEKQHAEMKAIEEKLATIARLEWVRDSIGFDAHGHEMVLLKRGDIPADHVCVGHALEVPADRTFRGAWVFDEAAGAVTHDLAKCVEIRKEQMRAARSPKLAALDCQWMKATGQGDAAAAAAAEAERQVLRDVTKDPDLAAAKTPEDLKAVWPACLT